MSSLTNPATFALRASQKMFDGFLADLLPADYLHRPVPKANCAAWITGHLVESERRALGRLGVTDLPALPAGFEARFGRDESAARAADFGDVTVLRPLFNAHRKLLIDAVERTPAEELSKPLEKPHPRFSTLGELAQFMALHANMHAGQLSTIRRSLGRPPLV